MKPSYINENGRFECEGVEFNSGDVVEVFIDEEWRITRIEHSFQNGGYYSIDGYLLLGLPIKKSVAI